jgi:hypothetical protein
LDFSLAFTTKTIFRTPDNTGTFWDEQKSIDVNLFCINSWLMILWPQVAWFIEPIADRENRPE